MTLSPDAKGPDDWSDLSRAWTDAASGEPPLDADLIRQLRRRDRLARWNFAGEIGGAVFVLAVIGWAFLFRGLPWPHVVASLGFAGFAVAMTLWSRRGDPGVLTETPEAVLRSAAGQARTGFRWAVAGLAITVAAMIFLVLITLMTPQGGLLNPLVIGGVTLLVACGAFYLRHARRCRRRMADHEAALAALASDPPPLSVPPPSFTGEGDHAEHGGGGAAGSGA